MTDRPRKITEEEKKGVLYDSLKADVYGNTLDDYALKILRTKNKLQLLRKRFEELKKDVGE